MVVVRNIVVVHHYILFTLLSFNYDITIDRMICAPGYGNDMVHVISSSDKKYLRTKICMVGTAEADNT